MMDFEMYLETRSKTDRIEALSDLTEALRKVFKDYSRQTRKQAWEHLISPSGKRLIDKLINNPERNMGQVKNLWDSKLK